MARPWSAWYEADYRRKTRHFTCAAQHGIYKNLLHHHLDEGPLTPVDSELRSIACATDDEWAKYWPDIRDQFFRKNKNGLWVNARAENERRKSAYHEKKASDKAKKAAGTRWANGVDHNLFGGDLPSADPVGEAVRLYNDMAQRCKLATCQKMDGARRQSLKARLDECGGIEGWKVALELVEVSDFLRGKNNRKWMIDMTSLVQSKTFTRLMEGGYGDNRNNKGGGDATDRGSRRAAILAGMRAAGMVPGTGSANGSDNFED